MRTGSFSIRPRVWTLVGLALVAGDLADAEEDAVSLHAAAASLPALSASDVDPTTDVAGVDRTAAAPAVTEAHDGFVAAWQARVHVAQASQPHWMTPLVTVTPRLEQEVRYDQVWQQLPNDARMHVYDGGKGLELIPTTTNEVLLNAPAYQERTQKNREQGFTDWQFLVLKQRLLSANEAQGDYILTSFVGLQAPRNESPFSNHTWVITPTIAGGVGWGAFDVQATIGSPIPMRLASTIGYSIASNIAFQYQLDAVFWPEVEVNDTRWLDGSQRHGLHQTYLTPGLILGRFPLFGNAIRAIIGAGYQYAVEPSRRSQPVATPAYGHAWIGTARIAF